MKKLFLKAAAIMCFIPFAAVADPVCNVRMINANYGFQGDGTKTSASVKQPLVVNGTIAFKAPLIGASGTLAMTLLQTTFDAANTTLANFTGTYTLGLTCRGTITLTKQGPTTLNPAPTLPMTVVDGGKTVLFYYSGANAELWTATATKM